MFVVTGSFDATREDVMDYLHSCGVKNIRQVAGTNLFPNKKYGYGFLSKLNTNRDLRIYDYENCELEYFV